MSTVRGSLDIARPVEVVFDFVADQRNETSFNPKMSASAKLTDGPLGVGTRFGATVLSRGKPLAVTIEYTGFDRPHRIVSRSVMAGATVAGLVRCDPVPEGTRFSWDWTVTIAGPGRFAGPLVAVFGRRQERIIWTGLKDHLEGVHGTAPRLPPRWFIEFAWKAHRALFRLTGGRRGLWPARAQRCGTMRVTTLGRRTGHERSVILAFLEDGPNLVTLAMNGWGDGAPAWWLNLQAHPRARVQLADGPREMVAQAATGRERARLWDRWRSVDKNLDSHATRRSTPTPVVVFRPLADPAETTSSPASGAV